MIQATKNQVIPILIGCVLLVLLGSFYMLRGDPITAVCTNIVGYTSDNSNNQTEKPHTQPPPLNSEPDDNDPSPNGDHKLTVLVAFRDREAHLNVFGFYMYSWLKTFLKKNFEILIIEQTPNGKFNRAKCFNVGFSLANPESDYFILHDVDLLPVVPENHYRWRPDTYIHLASCLPEFGYNLPYGSYAGAVGQITREGYQKINGMSNDFWGWGGEDDEFYSRLKINGIQMTRLSPQCVGRYEKLSHPKSTSLADNRWDLMGKVGEKWKTDGLNSLKYKLLNTTKTAYYTRFLVELEKVDD